MKRSSRRLVLVPPRADDDPEEPIARQDLEHVFRRFAPYVAAIGIRLLGADDEDLDDLVQDVLLDAHRFFRREPLPAVRSFKGWLATVTVRKATMRLRRRRWLRMMRLAPTAEVGLFMATPGATPEQRALLAAVYRVLDGVPVRERVAWLLHYGEGEPLDAVAAHMGCSLATAKRRIAVAHRAVKNSLVADEGALR